MWRLFLVFQGGFLQISFNVFDCGFFEVEFVLDGSAFVD
jgi:hypothetical protein